MASFSDLQNIPFQDVRMAEDFKLISMLNPEAHICRVKLYLLYDHLASFKKDLSRNRGITDSC